MRYQEGEHASGGDTGAYIGSSSEEVDTPVPVGTKRVYSRWQTAALGLVNSEGGGGMAVVDSPGTAETSQGRKRGTTAKEMGRRRGGGGESGAGAADVAGAVEQDFSPRRAGGGGAGGGAGGGGPGEQQEAGGGGGFWQNDNDGMAIGGRETSIPAAMWAVRVTEYTPLR